MKLEIVNLEEFKYTVILDEESISEDKVKQETIVEIQEYVYKRNGYIDRASLLEFHKTLKKSLDRNRGSSVFYNSVEDSTLSLTFSPNNDVRMILHHLIDDKTRLYRTDLSSRESFDAVLESLESILNL